jgi:hydroxymethylbilane synthase
MKIRIGSRESRLAVVQSQIVMDYIKRYCPEHEVELITMKTTGDIILDKTLDEVGGKGLFVKELDRALLDKEVDITVHSFKDMPMEVNPALPIVAVSKREDPRDVLVLPKGQTEIDFKKPIGCSSARRRIQLQKLFPQCKIEPVRGNVLTRISKLDSGEFSALVLAYAGLHRLGLNERISRVFEPSEILPAACQGILAIQARADYDISFLGDFNDRDALDISLAERSFVKALDGGCSSPVAAYGELQGDDILLTGLYLEEKTNKVLISAKKGSRSFASELGMELAEELKKEV